MQLPSKIPPNNTIFADNLVYARAYLKWFKLDELIWDVNVYGGALKSHYNRVVLVRPLEGVTQEHVLWILSSIVPKVRSANSITPVHWSYKELYS